MNILGLIDLPMWAILIACFILLCYIYVKYPGTIWKRLGVPSPPSMVFFGHMHKTFDPKHGLSNTLAQWTKQYGKIYGLLFFRKPALIVTDLEALKEIFVKDFNNYSDHYITGGYNLLQPAMKRSIFFNKGEDWKRIRRIMTPAFSTGKLKLLTHYMNTVAQNMAEVFHGHIESGNHPEAKAVFSAFSMDVLGGTAFGLDLNSLKNLDNPFYQHALAMLAPPAKAQMLMILSETFPFCGPILRFFGAGFISNAEIKYFEELFDKLIAEKKADPDQMDLLQLLINAESNSESEVVGKKLTKEEIIAQGILFVFGGYDTMSTALQWVALELAKNQDEQRKLVTEIEDIVGDVKDVGYEHCQKLKYMESFIQESMRLHPPIPILTRQRSGNGETTVHGHTVPSDGVIIVPVLNIGLDPEIFEDPLTFNPDRFSVDSSTYANQVTNPIAFLPFGFGHRSCLGQRQAMLQIKIALVHMLRSIHIHDVSPRDPEINDVTGMLIPKEPIKLILKRR